MSRPDSPYPFDEIHAITYGDVDTMKIGVEAKYVGSIIGRDGAVLKSIEADTGAEIHLQPKEDMQPHARVRMVHISGTSQQIHLAFELIAQLLETAAQKRVMKA